MPVGFCRRFRDAWVPDDDDTKTSMRRSKEGVVVRVEWHRSRSPDQHRLMFALLNAAMPMTDYAVVDDLLAAVKVKLGHFTLSFDGIPIPKSVAFDNLAQDEFNAFFEGASKLLAETVGVTPETLRAEATQPAYLSQAVRLRSAG